MPNYRERIAKRVIHCVSSNFQDLTDSKTLPDVKLENNEAPIFRYVNANGDEFLVTSARIVSMAANQRQTIWLKNVAQMMPDSDRRTTARNPELAKLDLLCDDGTRCQLLMSGRPTKDGEPSGDDLWELFNLLRWLTRFARRTESN